MADRASEQFDFDFIVVGSGFGGSVAALRLAEKGYSVAVLERGKRWRSADFPKSNWNLRKFLWAPLVRCFGIQAITVLRDVMILHGCGVGGGSLVYANTLLVPPDRIFADPRWSKLGRWKDDLAVHYTTAQRMLGVRRRRVKPTPTTCCARSRSSADRARRITPPRSACFSANRARPCPTLTSTDKGPSGQAAPNVAAAWSDAGTTPRTRSIKTICTWPKSSACKSFPRPKCSTSVSRRRAAIKSPLARSPTGSSNAAARSARAASCWPAECWAPCPCCYAARLAARWRDFPMPWAVTSAPIAKPSWAAPAASPTSTTRRGIAIASGFWPTEDTHVEMVRYGRGQDFMALLCTMLVSGGPPWPRPFRFLGEVVRHPLTFLRSLNPFGWARRTGILLVMQLLPNHMSMRLSRRWFWPFSKRLDTVWASPERVPKYFPIANELATELAGKMNGDACSGVGEVLFNTTTTAHILGGCPMGVDRQEGVIDKLGRVFGYDNLYVVDGSIVPVNLSVNPSLTITALAEWVLSHVAEKEPQVVLENRGIACPPWL